MISPPRETVDALFDLAVEPLESRVAQFEDLATSDAVA